MIRSERRCGLAVLAAMLVGCAGSDIPVEPTPYQPYNADPAPGHPAGGYLNNRLMDNVYLVTFRGTVATAQESVIAYAYRRAAEICGGDRRFEILKDEDVSKVEQETETRGAGFGGYGIVQIDAKSETYRNVWPRRRLTVRCKQD
jgi:hypothetical protein